MARWHQQRSKLDCLPVTRHEYGYVQRTRYQQPDLYHEEVVEPDSPFAFVLPSGTQLFTFLLLGDQNAGKSTLIHAFANSDDANFLELTSFVPILSSSFFNVRFLASDSRTSPRDEPPFIDTDLARGNFLMTLEDFVFMANEFGFVERVIDETARCFRARAGSDRARLDSIRFVLVQFIEIGGDHLDRMMQTTQGSSSSSSSNEDDSDMTPFVRDIVSQSVQLIRRAYSSIYFINVTSLTEPVAGISRRRKLSGVAFGRLLDRLEYLRTLLPERRRLLVYTSRLPARECFATEHREQDLLHVAREVSRVQQLSSHDGMVDVADVHPMTTLLGDVLPQIALARGWEIEIVGVHEVNHLVLPSDTDGSTDTLSAPLNVPSIMCTLGRLFLTDAALYQSSEPTAFVIAHLVQCAKQCHQHDHAADHASGSAQDHWIEQRRFRAFLEHLHFTDIPETTALQHFERVALLLERACMVVLRSRRQLPLLRIVCASTAAGEPRSALYSIEHAAAAEVADTNTSAPANVELTANAKTCTFYRADGTSHTVLHDDDALDALPSGTAPVAVRFPTYDPLRQLLTEAIEKHLPGDVWFGQPQSQQHQAPLPSLLSEPFMRESLRSVSESLVREIEARLRATAWPLVDDAVVLLLEDWSLAARLLGGLEGTTPPPPTEATATIRLPQQQQQAMTEGLALRQQREEEQPERRAVLLVEMI